MLYEVITLETGPDRLERGRALGAELHALIGRRDPLLEIAQELESIALEDDYFVERKLYPNVDFYTGLIYEA